MTLTLPTRSRTSRSSPGSSSRPTSSTGTRPSSPRCSSTSRRSVASTSRTCHRPRTCSRCPVADVLRADTSIRALSLGPSEAAPRRRRPSTEDGPVPGAAHPRERRRDDPTPAVTIAETAGPRSGQRSLPARSPRRRSKKQAIGKCRRAVAPHDESRSPPEARPRGCRRGRRRRRRGRRSGTARRRPDRGEGQPVYPRNSDHMLVADPRRVAPAVRRDGRPSDRRGRRGAGRKDEPRRVRDGIVDGELRVRPDQEPVGPLARSRRLLGRLGGGRCLRRGAALARLGHRRVDPPAGVVLRGGRGEANLRARVPLRADRVRQLARPGRPVRRHRRRRRPPARDDRRPRPGGLDVARRAGPRARRAAISDEGVDGPAHRGHRGVLGRRGSPKTREAVRTGRSRAARRRGRGRRRRRGSPSSSTGSPPTTSSPPQRRRPTSRATTASATGCVSTAPTSPR